VEAGPSASAAAIDLTAPDTEDAVVIKTEPGLSAVFQKAPDLVTEEGFIGKLVVRKSGKIELDWGGTMMELGKGAESEFLTTTLIVDPPGEEVVEMVMGMSFSRGAEKPTGVGCGMGKVMGKFVITPDFGELIDMD
jgi:DNA-directed RNA polymerase III subunit RPC4